MVDFIVYFFLCNIFISIMICILFAAKTVCKLKLSSQMQYHLSFLLFVFLILPFLPFRISILSSFHARNTYSDYINPVINKETSDHFIDASKQISDFAISVSHKTPSEIGYLLWFLWFIGIFIMIFFVIKSLFRLHKITQSSLPLQNNEVRNLYYKCLKEAQIHSKIPIYSTAFLKSPIIVGLLKPRIYLPIHAISDNNAVSMRFILLHELQHFKHKDMIINHFILIAGILYWFNPFVLYALNKIKCEREIACDCAVLKMLQESEYENYGNTLINFAEKISFSSFPFIAGIGGNIKQIKKRILNIANFKKESPCKKIQNYFTCTLILAVFFILLPIFPSYATRQNIYHFNEKDKNITYIDLNSKFKEYKGSFVLYDSSKDIWTIYNKEAALEQISPNSTYKIYNALLGLESGIITSEHSKMIWNKEKYPFDAWESDQDLNSAMYSSANWYFQNIDNMAGRNNIKSFLQYIGYGNQHISNNINLYWTDSSLKISPIEQVELLQKFYHNDFQYSNQNINAVKNAILISKTRYGTLYGKTGTGRVEGKDINGWFIGYIETYDKIYYFAINIQNSSNATGTIAAKLSLSILSDMGLWKE